jgi:hypothetical protein
MDDSQQIYFEPAHDVISLPSGGMFYKNKKDSVKVAYMTASDENILTSPNLLQSGKVLDVLLEKKILDKDIKAGDLLPGDRNAIIFFLRATGYGEMYPVELTDPKTGDSFIEDIDISQLPTKEVSLIPDENGECSFVLPKSGKTVKFKYLTSSEDEKLIKDDQIRTKKLGSNAINQVMTLRLQNQITEVDGIRDKTAIMQFVDSMSPMDSSKFRQYLTENEPGLDLTINVQAPSGEFFFGELPITAKFLWPYV